MNPFESPIDHQLNNQYTTALDFASSLVSDEMNIDHQLNNQYITALDFASSLVSDEMNEQIYFLALKGTLTQRSGGHEMRKIAPQRLEKEKIENAGSICVETL